MKRNLSGVISRDLQRKIILISEPRQSGKITLSKMIGNDYDYLNYDNSADRVRIQEQSWDRIRDR